MQNERTIKIAIGTSDIVAVILGFFTIVYTILFFPDQILLYLFGISLFLTLFMEKGVQVLFLIYVVLYLLMHQMFFIEIARYDIFTYLLMNVGQITGNHTILLINLVFFIFMGVISIIASTYLSSAYLNQRAHPRNASSSSSSSSSRKQETRNQNADYAASLSNIFLICFALILAILFAYDLVGPEMDTRAFEQVVRTFTASSEPSAEGYDQILQQGRNLAFLITLMQFYLFFSILYYVLFTLIFMSCFSIRVTITRIHRRDAKNDNRSAGLKHFIKDFFRKFQSTRASLEKETYSNTKINSENYRKRKLNHFKTSPNSKKSTNLKKSKKSTKENRRVL